MDEWASEVKIYLQTQNNAEFPTLILGLH